jgi:hypothetical protein
MVTSSALIDQTTPSLGAYQYPDNISTLGGSDPGSWSAPPLPEVWTVTFAEGGVGSYIIALDAVPGAINTGRIEIHYELYDETGELMGADDLSAPFTVSVDSAVPEPGSMALLLGAGLLAAAWRRRARASR